MPGSALGNLSPKRADHLLAQYVRRTVYPYSSYYRELLDQCGLGASGIRSRGDLVRLTPTDLGTVPDPGALVLRPDTLSMRRFGDRRLRLRAWTSRVVGREQRFNDTVIEPNFKPVHWVLCEGVPIGYSMADVALLGRLGAEWLDLSGLDDRDILVSLFPPGPSVAHWQLVQGARLAGIAALHLDPDIDGGAEQLVRLAPSVVAGQPNDLIRILGSVRSAGVSLSASTVLCIGDGHAPSPLARAAVKEQAAGATVVLGWVTPGVRVLWTECRGAAVAAAYEPMLVPAMHTWPATEVLEVDSDGQLLWTGVGWRGSAMLRLRTGATATLEDGPCRYCGVPGVRLRPTFGGHEP